MKKLAIIFCLLLSAISILGCANLSDNKANQAPMKSTSVDTAYLKKIHEKYFIAIKRLDKIFSDEMKLIEAKKVSDREYDDLLIKAINEKILPEINKIANAIKQEKRATQEEMITLTHLSLFIEAEQKVYEAIIMSSERRGINFREILEPAFFESKVAEYYYKKSYYKFVENKDYQVLNKEKFDDLKKGDSFHEVSRKLAMPGKLEGTEMKGDRLVQTYVWHENSGANIKVKFIDNRMYSAEQSGLK